MWRVSHQQQRTPTFAQTPWLQYAVSADNNCKPHGGRISKKEAFQLLQLERASVPDARGIVYDMLVYPASKMLLLVQMLFLTC